MAKYDYHHVRFAFLGFIMGINFIHLKTGLETDMAAQNTKAVTADIITFLIFTALAFGVWYFIGKTWNYGKKVESV